MLHHLQRQIDKLKKGILQLGGLVEQAADDAVDALTSRDAKLAKKVMDGDTAIDEMEIEIEEECLHTLALHQPVAHDLRYVVSVLKINNDLERMGDLAVSIAEQAAPLIGLPQIPEPIDMAAMAHKVIQMVKMSLDALVNIDPEQAQRVREMDNDVDDAHRMVYQVAQQRFREHPDQICQVMRYISISRSLERIADHATNIAEDVLYMAEGRIFRHGHRWEDERSDAEA